MPPIPTSVLSSLGKQPASRGLGAVIGAKVSARVEAEAEEARLRQEQSDAKRQAGPAQWFHRVVDVPTILGDGTHSSAKATANVYGPLLVHPRVTGCRMGGEGDWVVSQATTGLHILALGSKKECEKVAEEMVKFGAAALAQQTKDATKRLMPTWFLAYVKACRAAKKFIPSAPYRAKQKG